MKGRNAIDGICGRLGIDDPRYVEIESKYRIIPEDFADVRKFLLKRKGIKHEKTVLFIDQFLDTPSLDLLRRGASLRLRYKRNGGRVYLQYKGPGFRRDGLLVRSEFSSERLRHVMMEESHHDIAHFSNTSVLEILRGHSEPAMERAMALHLGKGTISRITAGPILAIYQKEKFLVHLGSSFLEPSLDRIFAFHIGRKAPHPLSTFCEYENEIKAADGDLDAKLKLLPVLLKFDSALAKKFRIRREPLDKYHRSASFFLGKRV